MSQRDDVPAWPVLWDRQELSRIECHRQKLQLEERRPELSTGQPHGLQGSGLMRNLRQTFLGQAVSLQKRHRLEGKLLAVANSCRQLPTVALLVFKS